jgi:hypothetical protein
VSGRRIRLRDDVALAAVDEESPLRRPSQTQIERNPLLTRQNLRQEAIAAFAEIQHQFAFARHRPDARNRRGPFELDFELSELQMRAVFLPEPVEGVVLAASLETQLDARLTGQSEARQLAELLEVDEQVAHIQRRRELESPVFVQSEVETAAHLERNQQAGSAMNLRHEQERDSTVLVDRFLGVEKVTFFQLKRTDSVARTHLVDQRPGRVKDPTHRAVRWRWRQVAIVLSRRAGLDLRNLGSPSVARENEHVVWTSRAPDLRLGRGLPGENRDETIPREMGMVAVTALRENRAAGRPNDQRPDRQEVQPEVVDRQDVDQAVPAWDLWMPSTSAL